MSTREFIIPKKLRIYEVNLSKALILETVENKELIPKNYKETLKIT